MHDLLQTKTFAESEILNQFQDFFSAFEGAVESVGGPTEVTAAIARQNVCLKFAGADLAAKLTRAIKHHRIGSNVQPDMTVCAWESDSSGRPLPPFLGEFMRLVNSNPNSGLRRFRGDVPLLTSRRFRAAIGDTSFTMADIEKKICVHWASGVQQIPPHEIAAPLRTPLNFLFGSSVRQLVHGGAVGTGDGGVFLGGFGGSGKSTTALNCVSSLDLGYAGDDYVLVDLKGQPTAFNVYGSAKVKTVADLDRFPQLKGFADPAAVSTPDQKPILFLNEHLTDKMINEVTLRAIVFPKFGAGEKIRYEQMSQQLAFREVATSTVRQTPGNEQDTISMIGRLVRELPCYKLTFGEDQSELASVLAQIIDKHR